MALVRHLVVTGQRLRGGHGGTSKDFDWIVGGSLIRECDDSQNNLRTCLTRVKTRVKISAILLSFDSTNANVLGFCLVVLSIEGGGRQ